MSLFSCIKRGNFVFLCDPLRGHCEAGSLTGAVHLSNDNAGVLRPAQCGRKPHVEHKGKCWLDLSLQYGARSRNVGLSILFILEFKERGVRKITTGIGDRAREPPRGVAWVLELRALANSACVSSVGRRLRSPVKYSFEERPAQIDTPAGRQLLGLSDGTPKLCLGRSRLLRDSC